MDCEFIAKRITELRMQKNISEQRMSFELGHSGNYIQLISSGKMMPSLKELFSICEFLEVSPALFFNEDIEVPAMVQRGVDSLNLLKKEDLELAVLILERLATNPK